MTTYVNTYDKRWLDTLAGRTPAAPAPDQPREDDDLDTAAWLRDALAQPAEPDPEPLDEATFRRVMNTLEARDAFVPPAGRKAASSTAAGATHGAPAYPVVLRRPGVGGLAPWAARAAAALHTGWAGAAAAGVVALALALLVLPDRPQGLAEPDVYTKGVPSFAAQRVPSPQPDVEAARLVAVLTRLGVAAQVQPLGPDRVVYATLPVAALPSFEAALQQEGLTVPADGRLVVQFAASSR